MPIKKECTICKVRHPEHPKLINVKEFEEKYTQSIEKEEWELTFKKTFNRIDGIAVSPMAIPSNVFDELKQFIKSLLLSREENYHCGGCHGEDKPKINRESEDFV